MSKSVHWTIPFQSVKGINYEIRIYDDYTGSVPAAWPVTLQAGETPITTKEDASDDFFTPVRPSTGTISVIDPDGTLMEQLIPSNNIARPVRLVSIDRTTTPATETIEWQGFLSCEAYQQDYTAIAQELQLSIISVLEAMDSVYLDDSMSTMMYIKDIIWNILCKIDTETAIYNGSDLITTYDRIYYPKEAYKILEKYLDASIFFSESEYVDGSNRILIAKSISAKECISKICTFMGWTVRESGKNIIFYRMSDAARMYYATMDGFHYFTLDENDEANIPHSLTPVNMSALLYRGDSHSKSIIQGAHSVKVTANTKSDDLSLKTPACTFDNVMDANKNGWGGDDGSLQYVRCIKSLITPYNNTYMLANYAWLCKQFELKDRLDWRCDYKDGILCYFDGFDASNPNYAYAIKLSSVKKYGLMPGFLKINFELPGIGLDKADQSTERWLNCNDIDEGYLGVSVKVGNKYFDGSVWTTTPSYLWIHINNREIATNARQYSPEPDGKEGYYIPISEYISGDVELGILKCFKRNSITYGTGTNLVVKYIVFGDISIEYSRVANQISTENDSNDYGQILSTKFIDDISIDTDFATYAYNKTSNSILNNEDDGSEPMTTMTYYNRNNVAQTRRPEADLVTRLANYYGRSRRKIELDTEHPTQDDTPLIILTGYDNRKYLPLAEERDWQQDTSKLTCYETPDGDA